MHALRLAGCDVVFTDHAKGVDLERIGLEEALVRCRAGDDLVVWRLDRLSRRQLHVAQILEFFSAQSVRLQIIDGLGASIDATQPEGRTLLGLLAGFGEYEWEAMRARTSAGVAAKRSSLWQKLEARCAPSIDNGDDKLSRAA